MAPTIARVKAGIFILKYGLNVKFQTSTDREGSQSRAEEMKDSKRTYFTVLILFVALVGGVVTFATLYYSAQADAFKSKLIKLGCQVRSLETGAPLFNSTVLNEPQFLDKIEELNATVIFYQYYTFYAFTSDLENGYACYIR